MSLENYQPADVSKEATIVAPISFGLILAALWANLPELALINVELWSTVATAIWALGGVWHLSNAGFWVLAAAISMPALIVTGLTVKLAIHNHNGAKA